MRFVGEPVAMVFADTYAQARAAADMIALEIDDLPVHLELQAGGADLHDAAPNNVAFDWALGDSAQMEAVKGEAAHVLSFEISDNRVICNSMEPRGCWADIEDGRLHLCVNGQGVWSQKGTIGEDAGPARKRDPRDQPRRRWRLWDESHGLSGVFPSRAGRARAQSSGALDVGPLGGDALGQWGAGPNLYGDPGVGRRSQDHRLSGADAGQYGCLFGSICPAHSNPAVFKSLDRSLRYSGRASAGDWDSTPIQRRWMPIVVRGVLRRFMFWNGPWIMRPVSWA